MTAYIARRLLAAIPLLLIASLITFGMIFLIPGDPATRIAGEGASPDQIAIVARDLGLDKPWWTQYFDFLGRLLHGDLGMSYSFNTPVRDMIASRLPITISLTIVAIVIAVLIGVPMGVIAGRAAPRWPDRVVTTITTLGLATPQFVLGLVLILFLAIRNKWLPATGYQPLGTGVWNWLRFLLMPGVALGVTAGAEIARQVRSSLVDVLTQDYVRTAVAKGLSRERVVLKHALKNALIPAVTVIGMQIAYLLGGTAIIETVFGIKGVGDFAVSSVLARDLPAIQGMVIFAVLVTVVASLIVDISYGYLNPRTRRTR